MKQQGIERPSIEEAEKASRAETTAAVADNGIQVSTHGGARKSKNQPDNSENVRLKEYGNKAEYRMAKLKRDHPEIAQRAAAGEFKSVSEAERAAGLKPELAPKLRLVVEPKPDAIAEKLKSVLSRDDQIRLAHLLRVP